MFKERSLCKKHLSEEDKEETLQGKCVLQL